MNATTFSIGNFKAFGPVAQRIPLKPITLVFGPNSAGKSSILHSLLWLRHAFEHDGIDVRFPELGRDQVDLGGFWQVTHRHDFSGRILISATLDEAALPDDLAEYWAIDQSVAIELAYGRIPAPRRGHAAQGLLEFRLILDGREFLRASRQSEPLLTIKILDLEHPSIRGALDAIGSVESGSEVVPRVAEGEDVVAEDESGFAAADAFLGFLLSCGSFRLTIDRNLPDKMPSPVRDAAAFSETLDVPAVRFVVETLPEAINRLVGAVTQALRGDLMRLDYVPPLRPLPPRYFDASQAPDSWRMMIDSPEVLQRLNEWLGHSRLETRYRIEMEVFVRCERIIQSLPGALQREMIRLFNAEPGIGFAIDALLESLREKWPEADRVALLNARPDYKEDLIDSELEIQADIADDWDDLTEEEKRRRAEATVEYIVADNPDDGWADALYEDYLAESEELREFIAEYWNIDRATKSVGSAITGPTQEHRTELILRHLDLNTTVSLQDVGIGVSQVLPVLIHCFASKERWIGVEQPEIHIHPALQAELGDVFIESALGGNKNTFLLETHSEHLILRILRRIRETTEGEMEGWPEELRKACPNGIRPEDMAVLYVQPGPEGAEVIELPVTPDGDFSRPWPSGFFTERARELY